MPPSSSSKRDGKVRLWRARFLPSGRQVRGPRLQPKKMGLARREKLAEYLVEHEMFPKAMVNRYWGLFLGRGFVNPIDDFNDKNQPSNPELLGTLAARFKRCNFDQKRLIRWITHSNAYHLSYVANKTNDKPEHETLFSRMIMKALSPEQLFESLMTATKAEQAESAAKKKELRDKWLTALIANLDEEANEPGASPFCNTIVRPISIADDMRGAATCKGPLCQALMMMYGKEINDAISRDRKGAVALAMASSRNATNIITELYLTALNRPPRSAELGGVLTKGSLRRGFKDSPKAMYEDLLWALLNANEFLLNH